MRIVGSDGEMHVLLPDGGTIPYDQFMYLRAAHLSCCEECSTKRLVRNAWQLRLIDSTEVLRNWGT